MLEYSLWLIADSRRLQDQSRRLALQQRAAFTTFIGQGIDMANTLLNVVVTSRFSLAPNLRVRMTYVRPPERRSASDAMSTSKDKYNPVHAQMQMPLPMLV